MRKTTLKNALAMSTLEARLIQWCEEHLIVLLYAAITCAAILLRYPLRCWISGDFETFLLPWYEEMKAMGGMGSLGTRIGNYGMLYQFLIACMTYLPIDAIYCFKLLSCIFDFVQAAAVAYIVAAVCKPSAVNGKPEHAWPPCAGYAAALFLPSVFLNSAAWAQCDSIYTSFLLLTIICMINRRYALGMIFAGIAFSFKLQAIFLFPFLLYFYWREKKFSILNFLLIPVSWIATCLPCLLSGRQAIDIIRIYTDQIGEYPLLYMIYPSFWAVFNRDPGNAPALLLRKAAVVLTAAVLLILLGWLIFRKTPNTISNLLIIAFLSSYTCVLFLPSMHERYGYLCEILAIAVIFINRKTIPLFAALELCTVFTYGTYLCWNEMNMQAVALLNVAVYIGYLIILLPRLQAGDGNSMQTGRQRA